MFAIDQEHGHIESWSTGLGDHAKTFSEKAGPLIGAYRRNEATVAFGGHFNSGKSTLLSLLIGRNILPVGSLPETGVACRLSAASQDGIRAIAPDGTTSEIAFDRDAIAEIISLYTRQGDRRLIEDMPALLDIGLADANIAPTAVWIDSPGINDSADMTHRALGIAVDADILLWVINSRQPMSDPEVELLRQFVALRGSEALVFALNVFLEYDSIENWESFCMRELPIHLDRIANRCAEIGIEGTLPDIHVISARAADAAGDGAFGARELRTALAEFASPTANSVRESRRRRVAIACDTLSKALAPTLKEMEARKAAAEAEHAEFETLIERRRTFVLNTEEAVKKALKKMADRIIADAGAIADGINSDNLKRDDTHKDAINSAIRKAVSGKDVADRIASEYVNAGLGIFPDAAARAIEEMVVARKVAVQVPDTPIKGGTIGAGAVAGGLLGAIFTGGLSLIATGIAAAAATAAASSSALNEDVTGTRLNIREAAKKESKRLKGLSSDVMNIVDEKCLGKKPARPNQFDPEPLRSLIALDEQYRLLPTRLG